MGMLDAALQFSNAQALTAAAQSTNFYDQLTGQMLTTTYTPTPAGVIWPVNETYFGEDLGIGKGHGTPRVQVNVGTAFLTVTTIQVQFQGAPENATSHASGNRSDLTFVTYMQTDTIALALLTANTRIASFDWPMRKTGQGLPRFVQLNYAITGASATAGTLNADVTLGDEDAQSTLVRLGLLDRNRERAALYLPGPQPR
jgi:hypothetical protein